MEYRCPVCRAELGRRKYGQVVVARMEMDCAHCGSTIHLNVHRAEVFVLYGSIAIIVVLALLSYWLQSQTLALLAVGAVMLGALALPFVEHVVLRRWPRYAAHPSREQR